MIGIVLTVLGTLLTMSTIARTKTRTALTVNGEEVSWSAIFNAPSFARQKNEFIDAVANNYAYLAAPLFLALGFLVFFIALSALHDDRRDRSILFWEVAARVGPADGAVEGRHRAAGGARHRAGAVLPA